MSIRYRQSLLRCSLLAACVCLSGLSCSERDKLHPVQGKVLYKNQPLSGALVTFHAKGADDLKADPPVGQTSDDGTFTLMTGQKTGARAGEYVVTIICSETPASKPGQISTGEVETQDRLKGAYAERTGSKITVTIKPGNNQLEPFDLK